MIACRRGKSASDQGETLVEILLAVAIMAVVMVGLITGLSTGVIASDNHRRLTDVEVVSRAYGEALVNQAMQPATTTLASITNATHITVASASGFPSSAPFTVSIDAEVVTVSAGAGTTSWTLSGSGMISTHATGVTVTAYNSCPTATQLTPSFTITGGNHVNQPSITSVEYFAADGTSITSASCATYWKTTAQPCSSFDPADQPHQTNCDPALIRATVTTTSTDPSASGRSASSVTRVLIRRGNA